MPLLIEVYDKHGTFTGVGKKRKRRNSIMSTFSVPLTSIAAKETVQLALPTTTIILSLITTTTTQTVQTTPSDH